MALVKLLPNNIVLVEYKGEFLRFEVDTSHPEELHIPTKEKNGGDWADVEVLRCISQAQDYLLGLTKKERLVFVY